MDSSANYVSWFIYFELLSVKLISTDNHFVIMLNTVNSLLTDTSTYLSTLPVLPGVSKFFIKSPGLQVRAPNLPGKSSASFEFFFFH